MPLRGIAAAAYRGVRVPESAALTAPRHRTYLPDSRQMPKCPFGTLREPGRPVICSLRAVGKMNIGDFNNLWAINLTIKIVSGISLRLTASLQIQSLLVLYVLIELKNNSIQPKENLSKHLGDGIFELRISFENRISRSFYFYESKQQIIFTHGFVKKEQKTPKGEIEKAMSIRKALRGEKWIPQKVLSKTDFWSWI